MMHFLLKGLLRDRSRSLFPVLMVTAGVMITVAGQAYFTGVLGSLVETSANFQTGYVKIMSRAYAKLAAEIPNDLALVGVDSLLKDLRRSYSTWKWTPRIHFGGLLDIPDKNGETRSQGPALGMAVDLLNPASGEMQRLNVRKSLMRGRLPQNPDEILISDELARKLEVEPGEVATLISSTMNGSMAIYNFTISGTVQFGIQALDKGAILADIRGIRNALDMDDAAGEIVGYQDDKMYLDETAQALPDN